jgi:NADH-quinone oxidoreductase subunit L
LLGLVVTDIKRVMAYSTISQLGYMMMGLGAFGFAAAIFHLFTHAFFKALLFLGAGSVNHATGTFDMRKMGGLARYMPVTFVATAVAGLALVGIFPFAGFWSKDEILGAAWEERPLVFWAALAGVFLTALYVGRMLILTFGGEYRGGGVPGHGSHAAEPRESPWVMVLPMVVLALLAVTAGFANVREGIDQLLEGALPQTVAEHQAEAGFEWAIALGSVALGLAGLGVAWLVYNTRAMSSESIRRALRPLPAILEQKYYLDWLYEEVMVRRGVLAGVAWGLDVWDRYVVDGIVNGTATLTRWSAGCLRLAQTGQAQVYGAAIVIGAVAAVIGILLVSP